MKNSNRSDRPGKKLQEKGYYIVLFLCVLAVGISGYIFVSTAIQQNSHQEESLSVPLTAEAIPGKTEQGKTTATAAPAEDEAEGEDDAAQEALRQAAKDAAVPPLTGEVIQTFSLDSLSYNNTTRDWRLHDAVDVAGEGNKVSACMAGTVTQVYDDDFYGTTVVIRHDGGYETRYANLTAMPTVKVGDTVKPGDVIGAVGTTAIAESAEQPHLHFQVLLNGQVIDPTEFLS